MKQNLASFEIQSLAGQAGSGYLLRYAADVQFQAETGEVYLAGDATVNYFDVTLEEDGEVWTCPTHEYDSTDDSSDPNATYSAWIVNSRGKILYSLFDRWVFRASMGTTFTYGALEAENVTRVPLRDDTAYSKVQTDLRINSQVDVGNPATTSAIGRVKVDTAPVDAASPVAVGTNSTLLPTTGQRQALAGTSGTPSSSNKYVTDADPRLFGGVNVRSYGAVGDGVVDDTASFTAAETALNAAGGGVFYVPRGKYKTSGGFVFTKPTLLRGDGVVNEGSSDYLSRVECDSPTAVLFTFSALNSHVEDVLLVNTSGSTPTAGAAIKAVHATADYARVTYSNIWVAGFYDGIDSEVGANWVLDSSIISDVVRYGVRVRNTLNPDTGDWFITNTALVQSSRQGDTAVRIESAGGGKIVNVKVNGVNGDPAAANFNYGIRATLPSPGASGILLIANSSIENYRGTGIDVNGWNFVIINGVEFGQYQNNGASNYAIHFDGVTDGIISGVVGQKSIPGGIAIQLDNCTRVLVGSYDFRDFTYPINFGFRYAGNWGQLPDPRDGRILQADAVFLPGLTART